MSFGSDSARRENFIKWNDYFMATALLAAKRSKDPISQVGACIVNMDQRIVGVGYNGMPNGCGNELPWSESGDKVNDKKFYVCHAEVNAVLNKYCANLNNCTMYVTLFPCNECAKVIIQAGIRKVIFFSDKKSHKPRTIASKRMLTAANVEFKMYVPKERKIVIDLYETDEENTNEQQPTSKRSRNEMERGATKNMN